MSDCTTTADSSNPAHLHEACARAVDFRGDVTIETTDGRRIEGFVFDAQLAPGSKACLRLLPSDGGPRLNVPLESIRALACTGKDAASGKSWESWLRRYAQKKLAGEVASIESDSL